MRCGVHQIKADIRLHSNDSACIEVCVTNQLIVLHYGSLYHLLPPPPSYKLPQHLPLNLPLTTSSPYNLFLLTGFPLTTPPYHPPSCHLLLLLPPLPLHVSPLPLTVSSSLPPPTPSFTVFPLTTSTTYPSSLLPLLLTTSTTYPYPFFYCIFSLPPPTPPLYCLLYQLKCLCGLEFMDFRDLTWRTAIFPTSVSMEIKPLQVHYTCVPASAASAFGGL